MIFYTYLVLGLWCLAVVLVVVGNVGRGMYLAMRRTTWVASGKGWAECPCCGCPTLDRSLPVPSCVVCEWEETDDEDELARARKNFQRYGVAYSPEDAATWGGTSPSPEEVAAKLEIIRLSRKTRERERDSGAWAAEVQAMLGALASARAEREERVVARELDDMEHADGGVPRLTDG